MYRFGRVTVDLAQRVVELDGQPQHLQPQAFDVLAHLIANRDRVVGKAELLDTVWGGQFVTESALTTRIKEIRRAVGDDGARQAVVRNHRGRGYRFVAEAEEQPTAARPAHPHGLIGRDTDVAQVTALLDRSRVVSLVGPGGVGKTTLARAVAREVEDRYVDGVKAVRLAPLRDTGEVIHALRRATGLQQAGPSDEDLITAAAALDAVILVDNCEHVVAEVARVVAAIAERRAQARVLTTSRERLGIGEERVWPVTPLEHPAARTLLAERARAALPGYAWREEDEPWVARLLEMLDRLPLAIEMAAARLPAIGLRELLAHLSERLDLLHTPDRSAAERHRTLQALIAWSEELLDPESRRLLADLSVFAGAVTAADIAAVVGWDVPVLAVGPLAGLVDRSLLVVDTLHDPPTYRLLETVRASVAGRREESVDARHAHHVAAVVSAAGWQVRGVDEATAAARIEGLVEEIRVAHRWARTHDLDLAAELNAALLFYAYEREWREPASWAAEGLEEAPETEGWRQAVFAAAVAADAADRGDYDRATRLAERARRSDDLRVIASALDTLASVGLYRGDLEAALRQGQAFSELGRTHQDPTACQMGLSIEMMTLVYGGRVADARALVEGRDQPRGACPTAAAWVAYSEAEILAGEGRSEEALARFQSSARLGASVGSDLVVNLARLSGLAVRSRTGPVAGSLRSFEDLLDHYRRTRSLTFAVTALRNLIVLLVRAEQDEVAMVLLGALSGPDVKSTYGRESDLLAAARDTAERRRGTARVAQWLRRGAAEDAWWAVDQAIAHLARETRSSDSV